MLNVVFATRNDHKLLEIKEILNNSEISFMSLSDAGFNRDIEENGSSFLENAEIKAREVCLELNLPVIADDSGLEVDFLDKAPGIFSARYMGETTSYDLKNRKIIELLKDVPFEKRTARFVCAAAFASPGVNKPIVISAVETFEGFIDYEIKGQNGFGYDPIFYVKEYRMTSAEMPGELKNRISHRGKALNSLIKKLENQKFL